MDSFSEKLNKSILQMYKDVVNLEDNAQKNLNFRIKLSISEIHFLEAVGACGKKGRTISELADALGVSKPSVTVAVTKLEKKGFVTKFHNQADGRSVQVILTHEGSKISAYYQYFRRRMVKKIINGLTDQEKEYLVRAFQKINVYFEESLGRIK